uniref:Leucine rich repeat containing 46 n=1 Tax=Calidris pygmaea TaxID=425635 RepID=A0A8C3KN98_9CHAR
MAGQGETLLEDHEQMSLGVTLTDSLIASRNLPQLVEPLHPESRSAELLSPSTIRLDRENICAIGRLQSLREIHSLYLQQNQIEKIENLGYFPNLRFLSLAGNRIRRVENLQPLRHLRVLDLSHNQIQTLDPDELPRSLRLLDLTGNECTHQHGYRWVRGACWGGAEGESESPKPHERLSRPLHPLKYPIQPKPPTQTPEIWISSQAGLWEGCAEGCQEEEIGAAPTQSQPRGCAVCRGYICSPLGACRELVVGALPHLLQLDAQPIHGSTCEEEEKGGSSSSEDEDDNLLFEPSGPFTAGKGAQTEAGHIACSGLKQAGPSVPKGDRSGREVLCQVSCNFAPSPSLCP